MLKIKIFLLSCTVCIAVSEAVLRIYPASFQFLRPTLFYSPAFSQLYRVSDNAELLIEPVPGARFSGSSGVSKFEKKYASRDITINANGFRGEEKPLAKTDGVFRIMVFGGSNIFGPSVGDDDTLPAQLEKKLNQELKRLGKKSRVEVWNGGLVAVVVSQAVAFARTKIEKFQPDFVMFQVFGNEGRRPFYGDYDVLKKSSDEANLTLFNKNPELYRENVPFAPVVSPLDPNSLHYTLLDHFELYKFLNILLNNISIKFEFPNHARWDCKGREEDCQSIADKYFTYGNFVGERELIRFHRDFSDRKILLLDSVRRKYCPGGIGTWNDMPIFSYCPAEGAGPEYTLGHPPSYVYENYASQLQEFLKPELSRLK